MTKRRGYWGPFLNGKSAGGEVLSSSIEEGRQVIVLRGDVKIFYEPIQEDSPLFEDDLPEIPVENGDVVAIVFHCHDGIKSKFAIWRNGQLAFDLWIGPDRLEMEDRLLRIFC